MLTRLKYIIVTLLVGWQFVSCSSDEPDTPACEMKFDIYSLSRSATTISNIAEKPFALFGDMIPTNIADNSSARTIIYNNTPVTHTNSGWTTPAPQYWYNDHLHSFVAVHPASVFSGQAASEATYLNSRLSFTYTLPSDYRQTTDILAATHRRKYTYAAQADKNGQLAVSFADVVYLRFVHLMSQINFAPALTDNIMSDDEYIEFHKLELTGFKTEGAFSIEPASLLTADRTDDRYIDVKARGAEGNLTIEFPNPVKILNHSGNVNLFSNDEAIIMVPQTFAAGSDAKIIFYYTLNGDHSIKQITLPLMNQKWDTGKNYTYRFSIDRTGPHFETTTITDWDMLDVGNIDAH